MQFAFHLQQFFPLTLHHFGHWNASSPADHFGNFLGPDLGAQQAMTRAGLLTRFFGLGFFQQLFQFRQLAVLKLSDLVEIAFARMRLDLLSQLIDLLTHVLTALRLRLLSAPDFL